MIASQPPSTKRQSCRLLLAHSCCLFWSAAVGSWPWAAGRPHEPTRAAGGSQARGRCSHGQRSGGVVGGRWPFCCDCPTSARGFYRAGERRGSALDAGRWMGRGLWGLLRESFCVKGSGQGSIFCDINDVTDDMRSSGGLEK